MYIVLMAHVKMACTNIFCLSWMFALFAFTGFDFGVRQSGERVDSVQLPSWCSNNSRLFILIHRQALESAYVRENLPHWIDLVFGYKQSGKAAVDAINVFHPAVCILLSSITHAGPENNYSIPYP